MNRMYKAIYIFYSTLKNCEWREDAGFWKWMMDRTWMFIRLGLGGRLPAKVDRKGR